MTISEIVDLTVTRLILERMIRMCTVGIKMKDEDESMREDRCVCCGSYVPEGQMVCHSCMCKVFLSDQFSLKHDMEMREMDEYAVSFSEKMHPKTVIRSFITLVRKLSYGRKENS